MTVKNHSAVLEGETQRQKRQQQKRLNRAGVGFGIFFVGWLVVILSTVYYKSSLALPYARQDHYKLNF